jgi:hypothetical protein
MYGIRNSAGISSGTFRAQAQARGPGGLFSRSTVGGLISVLDELRRNTGIGLTGGQRVLPLQMGKLREVSVRGLKRQAVLDRERRKMRIGNEPARHP